MGEMPTETPGSVEELAQILRESGDSRRAVELGGNFTKRAMGGPTASGGLMISTRRLDQIAAYEPKDLTISVGAGMGFADLTAALRRQGQMLPLDPPFAASATIGGVVATNGSGPRRRRYGTARDMVIGMTFVTADGSVVRSGGMVVKNVTGLDMAKLMIGSFGTLAAIASINFKLFSLPEMERTFVGVCESREPLLALRDVILRGALQPVAIDLLNPDAAALAAADLPRGHLLVTQVTGNSRAIDRYQREYERLAKESQIPTFSALREDAAAGVWDAIQNLTPGAAGERGCILRLSTQPSRLSRMFEAAVSANGPLPLVARAGAGVGYAYCSNSNSARHLVERSHAEGLRVVVESSPPEEKEKLLLWPRPGPDFALMERLKDSLDPHRVLNPGRLFGRL